MMRVIFLSLLFMSGCVTRGANGPCGFIGPNGAYIPCSRGGMPGGMWATPPRNYYQGRQDYQPPQRFRNSQRLQ